MASPLPQVLTNDEVFRFGLISGGQLPFDLIQRRIAARELCLGAGLVIGLTRGCLAKEVALLPNCPVRHLLIEDGSVVGVEAERGRQAWRLRARKSVVLASGGFEWDDRLSAELTGVVSANPVSPPVNRGASLRLAGEAAAQLARTSESWFWPVTQVPGAAWDDGSSRPQLVVAERALPHVIWVNREGRRFVNEASHNCALALLELDPGTHQPRNLPAFAIGDGQYRERYPVANAVPGTPAPEWLFEAPTLAELARLTGIDAVAFDQTVDRFNRFARAGRDDDFRRGESAYDRNLGDPTRPHPNLGTIRKPPFFAMPVLAGTVGTKGGPRTDENARVLRWDGTPVPGLHAAGNAMAAVIGPGTIAPGLTIGLALTWGWIAGTVAAGVNPGAP